ncbi:helix-turn-helix domain-containing protein [Vibrio maritimus]
MTRETSFGKALKHIRIELNETQESLGKSLGMSTSYLSALETGRKNIPGDFVKRLGAHYREQGYELNTETLSALANLVNGKVSLSELPDKQQLLVSWLSSRAMEDHLVAAVEAELERNGFSFNDMSLFLTPRS